MSESGKIAALAMLSPEERESARLACDVAQILDMGKAMPKRQASTEMRTVTADALRADTARAEADGDALLALSKKARDGYIVVSRTVGGDV